MRVNPYTESHQANPVPPLIPAVLVAVHTLRSVHRHPHWARNPATRRLPVVSTTQEPTPKSLAQTSPPDARPFLVQSNWHTHCMHWNNGPRGHVCPGAMAHPRNARTKASPHAVSNHRNRIVWAPFLFSGRLWWENAAPFF